MRLILLSFLLQLRDQLPVGDVPVYYSDMIKEQVSAIQPIMLGLHKR